MTTENCYHFLSTAYIMRASVFHNYQRFSNFCANLQIFSSVMNDRWFTHAVWWYRRWMAMARLSKKYHLKLLVQSFLGLEIPLKQCFDQFVIPIYNIHIVFTLSQKKYLCFFCFFHWRRVLCNKLHPVTPFSYHNNVNNWVPFDDGTQAAARL